VHHAIVIEKRADCLIDDERKLSVCSFKSPVELFSSYLMSLNCY
jgi:hypothetical protein